MFRVLFERCAMLSILTPHTPSHTLVLPAVRKCHASRYNGRPWTPYDGTRANATGSLQGDMASDATQTSVPESYNRLCDRPLDKSAMQAVSTLMCIGPVARSEEGASM